MNENILNIPIDIRTLNEYAKRLVTKENRRAITIREIIQLATPRVANREEVMQKMIHLSTLRNDCNLSEFARALGVSRQSVTNWKDNGYLAMTISNRIKVKETLELWEYLISQSRETHHSVHGYGAADLDKI